MQPAFDAVTRFIFSINNTSLTLVASFIDSYAPIIYILALILFANTLRMQKKFVKTLVAILIALLITFALKYGIQMPRPCMLDPSYIKVDCPISPDFSFPSGHEAIAAVVLAPFVGTAAFPLFFVLALAIGFLRINLGVHFLNDILAGFVIGFFSYDIIDRLFSKGTLAIRATAQAAKLEFRRQLLHILVGVFLVIALYASAALYPSTGPVYLEFVIFMGLLALLLMIHDRLRGNETALTSLLFNAFERAGARQGYGAFWYGMGALLAFVFIPNVNFLAATLIALGIGDGIATMVGRRGKIPNPLNNSKTVEGTLAFFFSTAILSYFFIGPLAIVLALLTSLVESLPAKFDDNFTIPLVSILLYMLVASAYPFLLL